MPPKAVKLLERMRQSQTNWKQNDIISLYEGFGFTIKHGSNHDLVRHSNYPELRQTIPRHKKVKPYIVKQAVKLIDRLKALQELEVEQDSEESEIDTDE